MPNWTWPRTRQQFSAPTKQHGGPPPGKGRGNRGNRGAAGGGGGGGGAPVLTSMGAYTGNGVDGRTISLPFTPELVIVKRVGSGSSVAVMRTADMTGDNTKPVTGPNLFQADYIQSFVANGFTLGTNLHVNTDTIPYVYVAMRSAGNVFQVGTYVGDGLNDKQVSVNFQPDVVIVFTQTNVRPIYRHSAMAVNDSQAFHQVTITTGIRAFNSSGFTVGTSALVNTSLTTYYFIAIKAHPSAIAIVNYSGDGADPRNLASFGFTPDFVLLRQYNTGTVPAFIRHVNGTAGDASQSLDASVADTANMIQAFITNGVELGSGANVNDATGTYTGFGLKATI